MPSVSTIGIDVGGTKTLGVLAIPETGEVLEERLAPTDAGQGGEAVLSRVIGMVEALAEAGNGLGRTPVGIGIGIAELVNLQGRVTSQATIDWSTVDYAGRLNAILPTTIDSDIRTAALAEARIGSGVGLRSFAYVSVGTGIGGCLVLDGRPVAGARGNAIVLGSGVLSTVCESCGANASSVLELVASGPAILKQYLDTGGEAASCEEVFANAASGDPGAAEILLRAGEALGVSVGLMVNLMDPEAIVLGGGVGSAGGQFETAFVERLRAHIWAEDTRKLAVKVTVLGGRASAIGAAMRCLDDPV